MWNIRVFLFCFFVSVNVCAGQSLLTPQKFPSTFSDASFVQRMEVLAQGYEPWESEFDSNGKCISGCAYVGITLEDEWADMQRQTQQVVAELQASGQLPQRSQQSGILTAGTGTVVQIAQVIADRVSTENETVAGDLPVGEPVAGKPSITSPYGRRVHPITGNLQNHNGVDFAVPVGTKVFSTADGVVENVWADNTCGNGLRIQHANGFETSFCHLDKVLVVNGDRVSKGTAVALSGNTGRSTGPHLHYSIKHDGIFIDPATLMGR